MTAPRYTLAWAPLPGTLGWLAGSHWLGRCAAQLRPLPQLDIAEVPPEVLHLLTASPRQWGWRAAWAPSFALAEGTNWLTLQATVHRLATQWQPMALPPLQVVRHAGALALAPAPGHRSHQALNAWATQCQQALQAIAAPQPKSQVSHEAGDDTPWTFHLPLTGPLHLVQPPLQDVVEDVAQQFFADLPPQHIDSLALFSQKHPQDDFVLLDHFELAPAPALSLTTP